MTIRAMMCDDMQTDPPRHSGLPGAIRAPPVVHKEVASLAGLSLGVFLDLQCWSAHFVMYHVYEIV